MEILGRIVVCKSDLMKIDLMKILVGHIVTIVIAYNCEGCYCHSLSFADGCYCHSLSYQEQLLS